MSGNKRIALGMSGGVDSATSAAILMRAGYEVVGVTCLFLDNPASHAAIKDAAAVCERLGIQQVVRDCVEDFDDFVVRPFIDDYAAGLTPSPCVHCNACCKIPSLLAVADEIGCDQVATGHYARVAQLESNGRFVIKAALDTSKDQSYMLSQLTQDQISRLVFPLGASTKAEVRIMAGDLGLPVADKPESQDICFIEGNHVDFLKANGVAESEGDIVTKEGRVVGKHQGLFAYTLGQRKGIGVAAEEPYYVIDKRIDTNELVVGYKGDARLTDLQVARVNWQAFETLDASLDCMVKLRYRSQSSACVVEPNGVGGDVIVHLLSAQDITSAGQFAVFYEGETLLGGGIII